MNTPSRSRSNARLPDRGFALEQYRLRAGVYDSELAVFEPLRREAVASLQLVPGASVLDVGCGTGLSLPLLAEAVGPQGRIVGIEQCPEMLAKARQRLEKVGPCEVALINAPVESAHWTGQADAALFHFTHDVLRRPEAIAHVLHHLKPGARVVATGLQWADPWAWPVNLFVWGAALRSVSTLDGLVEPWSGLAAHMPELEVRSTWMGGVFMASGTWPGRHAIPRPS